MFRVACARARNFTWPAVISHRTVNGRCSASVGSCVVVNPEGWIVTAGHILKECDKLAKAEQQTRAVQAQIHAIENDPNIDRAERRNRLRSVKSPKPTDTNNTAVWFGRDRVLVKEAYFLDNADIGTARLEPFDPAWVSQYPVFKDPSKNFEPGTSLCRMGFPFHGVVPIWDQANAAFQLPVGAVPLPLFPIEGIFTRTAEIVLAAGPGLPAVAHPFPLRMVETSSPGIPGQSGGPIFDTDGVVWAIQSSTTSFPLELNTPEKQYLNVGLGIHPDTIFGFLDDCKVKYQKSAN